MIGSRSDKATTTTTTTTNPDRLLWLGIRRGLLLIIAAIDARWGFGKDERGAH